MLLGYIIFIKPVDFLFIEKGEIFKLYQDYDKRYFIKIDSHKKIYITKERTKLGYYKFLEDKTLKVDKWRQDEF
jgi:hypothetical protein